MISITPQMHILVAVEPVDFRKGIDGLGGVCRQHLKQDPLSGGVFVFRNRRGTAIKILVYDGQGFWLCQKRLSAGKFRWWPESAGEAVRELEARELQLVLWNGNPKSAAMEPLWRGLDGQGKKGSEK
jgi:transposase